MPPAGSFAQFQVTGQPTKRSEPDAGESRWRLGIWLKSALFEREQANDPSDNVLTLDVKGVIMKTSLDVAAKKPRIDEDHESSQATGRLGRRCRL